MLHFSENFCSNKKVFICCNITVKKSFDHSIQTNSIKNFFLSKKSYKYICVYYLRLWHCLLGSAVLTSMKPEWPSKQSISVSSNSVVVG